MRFRLRTLLVVSVLLALTAPWWNQWRRDVANWMWPSKPAAMDANDQDMPPGTVIEEYPIEGLPVRVITAEEFAPKWLRQSQRRHLRPET